MHRHDRNVFSAVINWLFKMDGGKNKLSNPYIFIYVYVCGGMDTKLFLNRINADLYLHILGMSGLVCLFDTGK